MKTRSRSKYARAYEDVRRRQQFEQIAHLKKELANLLPDVEPHELLVMVGRCTHYDWGDRKELGPKEAVLYRYLKRKQLQPRTVYRWFRLSIMPEDVQQRVIEGSLSHDQGLRLATNRKRQRHVSLKWRFMEEARRAVRDALAE